MPTPPTRPFEPLAPDTAARLAEFAKACKAATRVVSMYPPSHPTIQTALARITGAGKQLLSSGPAPSRSCPTHCSSMVADSPSPIQPPVNWQHCCTCS